MESAINKAENNSKSYQTNVCEKLSYEKLKSIRRLFKDTFNLFYLKFKTVVNIMFFPTLLTIVLNSIELTSLASPILSQSSWVSVIKILFYIILLYLIPVSTAALFISVKEDVGTKEAYRRAIKISPFFILVAILNMSMIAGGFVLLVVPGILFSVWFILAETTYIFENQKGFNALYRSKQLVSGNFWEVLRRVIFMVIILSIVSIPFSFIGNILVGTPYEFILNSIFKLFVVPLWVFFLILLYKDLLRLKQAQIVQKPVKLFRFFSYFTGVIGVFLVFVFILLRGFIFLGNDIPNPNDSDLQLSAINVPVNQNSYYIFRQAKDKVYWPAEAGASKEMDTVLENEILQKNEQALNIFEKGIVFSIFQQPQYQDPKDIVSEQGIESLSYLRNLAKINSLKATSFLKQEKDREAFDQALKTIKMAQMLEDGQGDLVHYLVGIAIKQIGAENLKSIIVNSRLSSSELLNYEKELDKYVDSRSAEQNALKFEYIKTINNIQEENKNLLDVIGARSIYFYKPNKMKLLYIENYRINIANASKDSYIQLVQPKEIEPFKWTDALADNCIGKLLFNASATYFIGLNEKKFNEELSMEEVQVLLALKAYKQDNNCMPDSLQDLIPKYLDKLTIDPYDGKTLRYSPEKKIVYSVGRDLADNGGSIFGNNPKDLGFEIGF